MGRLKSSFYYYEVSNSSEVKVKDLIRINTIKLITNIVPCSKFITLYMKQVLLRL